MILGQTVLEIHDCLTLWRTNYDAGRAKFIDIYRSYENDFSDGFGLNFSGAAFYLPHQLVARGSSNFTRLSHTTGPTNMLDMTSPFASGRLQHATKYCTHLNTIFFWTNLDYKLKRKKNTNIIDCQMWPIAWVVRCHKQLYFQAKRRMAFCRMCWPRHCSSSTTKWVARISREWFVPKKITKFRM